MANPLDNCNDADLKRFALCWLYSDRQTTDWAAAAANYDSKVQVASFKTVTGRAAVKALKDTPLADAEKPKKAAGGAKRKKAAGEDGEDAPKAKKGKGGKKAKKSDEKVESDAEDADGAAAKGSDAE